MQSFYFAIGHSVRETGLFNVLFKFSGCQGNRKWY